MSLQRHEKSDFLVSFASDDETRRKIGGGATLPLRVNRSVRNVAESGRLPSTMTRVFKDYVFIVQAFLFPCFGLNINSSHRHELSVSISLKHCGGRKGGISRNGRSQRVSQEVLPFDW